MSAPVEVPAVGGEEEACRLSLLDALATIPDERRSRGRLYRMASVLALCIVGTLCGCKNPSQVCVFGRRRPGLLKQLGFVPPKRPRRREDRGRVRGPNEDTIVHLVASVAPEALGRALELWLKPLLRRRGEVAAVDGKALRGTGETVLSVFVDRLRLVVWQAEVDGKKNETSMLEDKLVEILAEFPALSLFTGDAAFCQKAIARQLVDAHRDYLLQLKSPHTTDVAIAKDAMRQLSTRPPLASSEEKRGAHADPCRSATSCGAT